jgi:hypothetical protein
MSRIGYLKRELQATACWLPKSTLERISAGLTLNEAELNALLRANAVDLPEPKFPILGVEESQAFFDCVGVGA